MGIDFVSALQQSERVYRTIVTKSGYEIEEQKDWGVGFYLLHGLRDGFYSHNDFTRSTSALVDLATKLLRNEESSPRNVDSRDVQEAVFNLRDEGPWSGNIRDDLSELADFIQDVMNDYPSVNYRFNISGKSINKTIQNSFGAHITHKFDTFQLDLVFSPKTSSHKIQRSIGGIQNTDLNYDTVLHILKNSINELRGLTEATRLKAGNYNVILSPDTAYSMIHESIGHGCESDQVINGISFLTNKIGHKIGSSQLTVTDDPHLRGKGWCEYDDEGTKTKGTLLVEDGILVDYLNSTQTAKILNQPKTGNARSSSYLHKPEPRQSNLFVEPKDNTLEELFQKYPNAVYIGPSFVASTSIYTGDIYIESQYGRNINGDRLGNFHLPIILADNALNLLNKIIDIGGQIEKFPTECLKSTSKIDIGAYSPPIVLEDVHLQ